MFVWSFGVYGLVVWVSFYDDIINVNIIGIWRGVIYDLEFSGIGEVNVGDNYGFIVMLIIDKFII